LLEANLLHLISTIAIFSAAIIPIYISIRIKTGNKLRIRAITVTLTIFILIHGLYHIFGFFGYRLVAEGFFEPLSVITLILFALLMIKILYPKSFYILRKQKGDFNYI
jgi:hypothetical protein